jgi:hypothetical protein
MPEDPIYSENTIIPTSGTRILCHSKRLEYSLEQFIQHLSVCLLLFIQPLQTNVAVLDWNPQESDHYNAVDCGHLADL